MTLATTFRVKGGGKSWVSILSFGISVDNPPGWNRRPLLIPLEHVLAVTSAVSVSILTIHYVRKTNRIWSLKKIELRHALREVIMEWTAFLKDAVRAQRNRPQSLLFYINPYGGKGRAEEVFKENVKPLLELAEVEFEAEVTPHADYASKRLAVRELDRFEGVIAVGGDGMFSEVFNGLLSRTAHDHDLDVDDDTVELVPPGLRVGIVPAGSTDAVALSLHGTRDVETSVLHILLGDRAYIDVSGVYCQKKLERFSMTMLSYGFFGDLLKRSENCRWMGPCRYDFSGFQTLLSNHSYEGTITMVQDEDNENLSPDSGVCLEGCQVCEDAQRQDSEKRTCTKTINGSFMSVTAATLTCACPKSPKGVSPSAHLGDGNADLILVRRCSRWNYLRYLFRTGFSIGDPFRLPFVRLYRVREMTFLPTNNSVRSVWNCDGEVLLEPQIRIKVHCQILPVFARGVSKKRVSNI